jgi:hypothetical protein
MVGAAADVKRGVRFPAPPAARVAGIASNLWSSRHPLLVTRYPLPATHNLTTLADLMLGFFRMESSTSVEGDESRFKTVSASPPT